MSKRPHLPKRIVARFFKTATGNQPVREFLLELDDDDRKVVGRDIAKVEFGWPIGLPVCRPIGKGLFEVRSNISDKKIARVMFGNIGNELVLLHGFIKKSQKTPKSDLDLARNRLAEVEYEKED